MVQEIIEEIEEKRTVKKRLNLEQRLLQEASSALDRKQNMLSTATRERTVDEILAGAQSDRDMLPTLEEEGRATLPEIAGSTPAAVDVGLRCEAAQWSAAACSARPKRKEPSLVWINAGMRQSLSWAAKPLMYELVMRRSRRCAKAPEVSGWMPTVCRRPVLWSNPILPMT